MRSDPSSRELSRISRPRSFAAGVRLSRCELRSRATNPLGVPPCRRVAGADQPGIFVEKPVALPGRSRPPSYAMASPGSPATRGSATGLLAGRLPRIRSRAAGTSGGRSIQSARSPWPTGGDFCHGFARHPTSRCSYDGFACCRVESLRHTMRSRVHCYGRPLTTISVPGVDFVRRGRMV